MPLNEILELVLVWKSFRKGQIPVSKYFIGHFSSSGDVTNQFERKFGNAKNDFDAFPPVGGSCYGQKGRNAVPSSFTFAGSC